jgi:hypothetical protein
VKKNKGSRAGQGLGLPGPKMPEDMPDDKIVDEEWADKHGGDLVAVSNNQKIKDYEKARNRGQKVQLDLTDSVAKLEYYRNRPDLHEAMLILRQIEPETHDGIPGCKLRAIRTWDDLVARVSPFWKGGPATFSWTIFSAGRKVAQADFRLSGEKEIEQVAKQETPPGPSQPYWDGSRWVYPGPPAQQPPPPMSAPPWAAPPGYAPPQPAPTASFDPKAAPGWYWHPTEGWKNALVEKPPPPAPASGDLMSTLLHKIEMLEWKLSQQQQVAPPAPQPQASQPFDPKTAPGWYWHPTEGWKNALSQSAAPPVSAPTHTDPFAEAEKGAEYLKRAHDLAQSIARKVVPEVVQQPKTEAPKVDDDGLPVAVKMIGDVSVPMMRETGEVNTGLLLAGNMGLVENKLSKGFDKVMEAIKEARKAKMETVEAQQRATSESEAAAERQRQLNAQAAETERAKNEEHVRRLSQIKVEEEKRIAMEIIAAARRPPPPPDLGTLGNGPPKVEPAAAPTEPATTEEPTPN